MPELTALYLTSIFLIGALALLGRHNRSSGWRRKRSTLAQEIQETMEELRSQPPAATAGMPRGMPAGPQNAEAHVMFSTQLARLQARLAQRGLASPQKQALPEVETEVPVRRVP